MSGERRGTEPLEANEDVCGLSTHQIEEIVVAAGETRVIAERTSTRRLRIADGSSLAAPDGRHLTVTVDGVETGSVLPSTYATATVVAPGAYEGDIVISVTDDNPVESMGETFHLRQAAYVDRGRLDPARSAMSAVVGGELGDTVARGVRIDSTGEAFGGFFVSDSEYTLQRPRITFEGNGRSDFAGQGAAVVARGAGTRLVIEDAEIRTSGAVRAALVADAGANVIVKRSVLDTTDGELPEDYAFSLSPGLMSVPWVLGLAGNVRSSVCMGPGTNVTYIDSTLRSANWGVVSSDAIMMRDFSNRAHSVTINCDATVTGRDGYGAYADQHADTHLLGTRFTGVTYGGILGAGNITLGDSSPDAVAALDAELDLRLTPDELAAITPRPTTIESTRFGFMWQLFEGGTVTITGATRIVTEKTMFITKAVPSRLVVDGSGGASLVAGNGVLVQLMDEDNPMIGHIEEPERAFSDPDEPIVRDEQWAPTVAHDGDAHATFPRIELRGSLFNAMRNGKNLVVTLEESAIEGNISASTIRHRVPSIGPEEYREINEVDNTPAPAVNNGVVLSLTDSTWTVDGISHLTSLTLDAASRIQAVEGAEAVLTVDGVERPITAGTYTGAVTIAPRAAQH